MTVEDPSIETARRRFIAFRDIYPPENPGLCFYGGVPVGPAEMVWPRNETEGKPLNFVMQWDARALATADVTGLLPRDGALYLFSNLGWGDGLAFRFVHVGGDGRNWVRLPEPEGLPPIASAERQGQPPGLPRCQPFLPIGIDYPACSAIDEDESDGPQFWANAQAVKEAILRAEEAIAAPAIPAEEAEGCKYHRLAVLTIREENENEFKDRTGLTVKWPEISAVHRQAKEAGELRIVRDIWAPPPDRMFGPPCWVQGDVEAFVWEWVLLLELSSSNVVGWPAGDGVLQFMVRPDDLLALRFDEVAAICTGY